MMSGVRTTSRSLAGAHASPTPLKRLRLRRSPGIHHAYAQVTHVNARDGPPATTGVAPSPRCVLPPTKGKSDDESEVSVECVAVGSCNDRGLCSRLGRRNNQ